jgi:hypothetical protein
MRDNMRRLKNLQGGEEKNGTVPVVKLRAEKKKAKLAYGRA